MASYRGHLTFSTALGASYAGLAMWQFHMDWGVAGLAGGLTAVGGLVPDLDSDSGVPVRELFGLAAVVAPFLVLGRLEALGLAQEQVLLALTAVYLLVRYGVSALFKRVTVHRGMFHSVPAMLIAGLVVFMAYQHPRPAIRLFLASGMMLGFLSHLVLDELCSVDFSGVKPTLNKFAGSALKFFSASWPATLATYALLLGLAYVASLELGGPRQSWEGVRQWALTVLVSPQRQTLGP
jgi:hypothetical protein